MAIAVRMRTTHITRAVAAMDRCFALVGAHQHGIVNTVSLADHRPCFVLPRRMESTSTHVVAVGWECLLYVRSLSGLYKAREWMNTEITQNRFEILV